MKTVFGWILVALAFICLIGWQFLTGLYLWLLPHAPVVDATIPFDSHGTIFYMTQWQHLLLSSAWIGFFMFGIPGGFLLRSWWEKQVGKSPR